MVERIATVGVNRPLSIIQSPYSLGMERYVYDDGLAYSPLLFTRSVLMRAKSDPVMGPAVCAIMCIK